MFHYKDIITCCQRSVFLPSSISSGKSWNKSLLLSQTNIYGTYANVCHFIYTYFHILLLDKVYLLATPSHNYAFIDSQNLNLGVETMGWQVDYRKLRLYLKNKYNVDRAFMFIGLVANNQKLYTQLQADGFILIFKPTVRYFENGRETVKGNVDAELILHASAIEYANYDKAIIASGDGDFACLVEFFEDKDKLLHILLL